MSKPVEIPQDDLNSLIIEETFTVGRFSTTIKPVSWVRKKGFGWALHQTIKVVLKDGKDNLIDNLPKIFDHLMDAYPAIMELASGIGRESIKNLQMPEQIELLDKIIKVNRLADEAFKKKCIDLVRNFKEVEKVEETEPTIEQMIQNGES